VIALLALLRTTVMETDPMSRAEERLYSLLYSLVEDCYERPNLNKRRIEDITQHLWTALSRLGLAEFVDEALAAQIRAVADERKQQGWVP